MTNYQLQIPITIPLPISLPIRGHLSCLHYLAILRGVAMDVIGCLLDTLGLYQGTEDRLYRTYTFSFLRILGFVFHCGWFYIPLSSLLGIVMHVLYYNWDLL